MNRLSCLLLLAPLLGCPEGVGAFSVTEESAEATVMGSSGLLELPLDIFPPLTIDINLDEELAAQDAGPAQGVFLTALSTEITDTARPEGDEDNFDFVDTVEVFVASTKEGSTLEQMKIAEIQTVPEGVTTLNFTVQDSVNLKPYVEEGMRLVTRGSGEVPDDDTSLKAIVTLRISLL